MTRFLLFILYYVLAFALGFAIRGRYDAWMYGKPHMQARLRVFAQEAMLYDPDDPDAEEEDFFPPATTDPLAFNAQQAFRAVRERQAELDQVFAEVSAQARKAADAGDGKPAASAEERAVSSNSSASSPAAAGGAASVPEPQGYAAAGATALVDPVVAAKDVVDPLADGHYDPSAPGGYRATGAAGTVAAEPSVGGDPSPALAGAAVPDGGPEKPDMEAFERAAAALEAGSDNVAPPLAAPAEGVSYGDPPPNIGWPDPSKLVGEAGFQTPQGSDPGEDIDVEAEMARLAAIERGEAPPS